MEEGLLHPQHGWVGAGRVSEPWAEHEPAQALTGLNNPDQPRLGSPPPPMGPEAIEAQPGTGSPLPELSWSSVGLQCKHSHAPA